MKRIRKSAISLICILLLIISVTPVSVFAEGEESQEDNNQAKLELLAVTTGQNAQFTSRTILGYNSTFNPVTDNYFLAKGSNPSGAGNVTLSYVQIMCTPLHDSAEVVVYCTAGYRMQSNTQDGFTGKYKLSKQYNKKYKDKTNRTYYTFQNCAGEGRALAYRVEVRENGVVNNYDIAVVSDTCENELSDIQAAFVNVVDVQTDVSEFTSSAKGLVETAKPMFKEMMDKATTAQEACRIANQFNMIVCSAKEIEDQTIDLKDELEGAKTALGEVDTKVKTAAQSAVAAAKELDMEKFSEEDAAAIEGALSALETELAKEDAKTADILDAKEALDKAVIDAKVNALETEKAAVEEDLKEANAALETATEETIPDLQKTIIDLNDKIDQLEKDLKAARDEYDKAAAENKELLKQIEDLTKAKESAEKQLKAVKDELRNVTNLLVDQSIESALDHAESVINTTVKELSNTSAAIADNALRKVIEAANEAINKATADLSGVLGSNAEAMNKMIERFDGASERLSKAGEKLADAIATGGTSAREKAELRKQIKEAAAELEKAQKDIETLRADLDKASDDSELQKQIEDLTGELSTAKGELEQTKADLEAAQAALLLATKPAKVDTISVQAGKKKVTVTWSETERAEGFVVYRSLKKKKGYKAVKTIKSGATFKYTDKKVVQGKKYFYKVRAYKMYDGNKLYGAYSAVKKTGKVQ